VEFRTTDKRLFDFLIGRGHNNWRVRLEGGAYVARFRDTERLRCGVSEFNNGQCTKVRTLNELASALIH